MTEQQSFYDAVGGAQTFRRGVAPVFEPGGGDENLRPLYPGPGLARAEDRPRGGPRTYSDQRGHPRLRMRHVPYRIGPLERDAWLRCMHTAIAEIDAQTLDDAHRRALVDYLEMAADSMMNSPF